MTKAKFILHKATLGILLLSSMITAIPFIILVIEACVNSDESILSSSVQYVFEPYDNGNV